MGRVATPPRLVERTRKRFDESAGGSGWRRGSPAPPLALLFLALAAVFLFGGGRGHFYLDSIHNGLTWNHMAVAVNLSPEHDFLGFYRLTLDDDGDLTYQPYNRFPVLGHALIKLATLPFPDDVPARLAAARMLMLAFFAAAAATACLALCRLVRNRWAALAELADGDAVEGVESSPLAPRSNPYQEVRAAIATGGFGAPVRPVPGTGEGRTDGDGSEVGAFDLYLHDGTLAWPKEPCTTGDTAPRFFLHLVPADPADLPACRRKYGFDNRDFDFEEFGTRFDGRVGVGMPRSRQASRPCHRLPAHRPARVPFGPPLEGRDRTPVKRGRVQSQWIRLHPVR